MRLPRTLRAVFDFYFFSRLNVESSNDINGQFFAATKGNIRGLGPKGFP